MKGDIRFALTATRAIDEVVDWYLAEAPEQVDRILKLLDEAVVFIPDTILRSH